MTKVKQDKTFTVFDLPVYHALAIVIILATLLLT